MSWGGFKEAERTIARNENEQMEELKDYVKSMNQENNAIVGMDVLQTYSLLSQIADAKARNASAEEIETLIRVFCAKEGLDVDAILAQMELINKMVFDFNLNDSKLLDEIEYAIREKDALHTLTTLYMFIDKMSQAFAEDRIGIYELELSISSFLDQFGISVNSYGHREVLKREIYKDSLQYFEKNLSTFIDGMISSLGTFVNGLVKYFGFILDVIIGMIPYLGDIYTIATSIVGFSFGGTISGMQKWWGIMKGAYSLMWSLATGGASGVAKAYEKLGSLIGTVSQMGTQGVLNLLTDYRLIVKAVASGLKSNIANSPQTLAIYLGDIIINLADGVEWTSVTFDEVFSIIFDSIGESLFGGD